MAEFGSHHFLIQGGSKPSIFAILAQESLSSGLRDACRHFCKVLAENFPEKFGSLLKHFEEFYLVGDFIFHFVHLRIYGASFAEHFYGMKRVPDPRTTLLSSKRLLVWVSVMTVFPYLQIQFESLFKKIREKDADGSFNVLREQVKAVAIFYKKLYPSLNFIWESIILYYYMSYALHKNNYHSPLLHIISAKLVNSTGDDEIQESYEGKFLTEQWRVCAIMWKMMKIIIGSVSVSVSVGSFFLQFLDWWYSREGKTSFLPPLPVPPPPPKWPFSTSLEKCPLCQKRRTNDTALSCSGFVFCYPCIFKHVEEKKSCPVTGYPATLDELVKIYQQKES